MLILVDTDIIIDYLRIKTGLLVDLMKRQTAGDVQLYYSAVTVIELFTGESSVDEEETIEGVLKPMLIVDLNKDIAKLAGELRRKLKNVALGDLIVGASAVYLNAQLATSNSEHFSKIPGLKFFKGKKKSN